MQIYKIKKAVRQRRPAFSSHVLGWRLVARESQGDTIVVYRRALKITNKLRLGGWLDD